MGTATPPSTRQRMVRNGRRRAAKMGGAAKLGQIAEEPEVAGIERRLEAGQKESSVETRQHLYRQKEAGAAADPTGPVDRGPATRHDAVDMGMMVQVLPPGVQ